MCCPCGKILPIVIMTLVMIGGLLLGVFGQFSSALKNNSISDFLIVISIVLLVLGGYLVYQKRQEKKVCNEEDCNKQKSE